MRRPFGMKTAEDKKLDASTKRAGLGRERHRTDQSRPIKNNF